MKAAYTSPIAISPSWFIVASALTFAVLMRPGPLQAQTSVAGKSPPTSIPVGEARTNRVLSLDGKTGCMAVADAPAPHTLSNAMTREVWFKAASFYQDGGGGNSLLRKNVAANSENFSPPFRTIDGKPWVGVSPGNDLGVLRASYDLATGQWYHLAATYDGSAVRLFV